MGLVNVIFNMERMRLKDGVEIMTIQFDISIKAKTKLLKDIEALINKHKDDIENVTTQYVQSHTTLWQVVIQFHPISIHNIQPEKKEDESS